MFHLPRSRLAVAAYVGAAVVIAVLGLRSSGVLEPLELSALDLRVRLGSEAPISPPPVHLILIGEEDIERYGHPLPDAQLDRLIEIVLAADPRAVGIDLYRDFPVPTASGAATTPAYEALGRSIRQDGRVVMVMGLPDSTGRGISPPSFLADFAQVGFADMVIDPDGRIRRGLLFVWQDDVPVLSFAMQLALRTLQPDGLGLEPAPGNPDHIALGPTPVPPFEGDFGPYAGADDSGYQFLLDFAWGMRDIPTSTLREVLEAPVPPVELRGAVVMVGTASNSVKDSHFTPLRGDEMTGTLFGVVWHAHAVHQLLRHASGESRPLRSFSTAQTAILVALVGFLGAGLGTLSRSLLLQLALAASGAAVLAAGGFVGMLQGWWVPVSSPLLAGTSSAIIAITIVSAMERAERREVVSLFSRFQGASVAEEIWHRRAEFLGPTGRPVPRRVTLTAMMSDLEGYTAAAEKMDPEALMTWVNEYMNRMAQLVEEHGGSVDDYAGDGIKANFGFPVPSESEEQRDADAVDAVRCALAMGAEMEALNARWRERGLPTGRCRIGLFTGPAVIGCIGSDRALKLTSVGDTVNTASRLEGFGKDDFKSEAGSNDWRILIGDATRQRVGDAFEIVSIGAHRLKGKNRAIPIHRVLRKTR